MDLKAVLNEGAAPEQRAPAPPPAHSPSAAADPLVTPATPGANGYGSYHPATRHGSGMQQYPFTAQPQQQQTQQVAGQGQARPPSHGAHSHPSPAPYAPPSASPTPSSSHHSPLSVTHPPPSAPQPLYHSSQPGTPFGPPPPPTTSPIYPRTVTAASPSNNPRLGSGIPLESPRAVFREQSPPHLRRSSDYFDRERSVSVSPKTIPPPRRPDSLSSRHSSQDNMSAPTHTARPAAGAAAGAAAQSHVPPFPSPHAVAQTAAPHYYPPARDVVPSGQTTHPLSSLSAASGGPRGASSAASPDSLSELGPPHHPQSHVQQQQQALYSQPPRPPSSQSRPPLIQHHSSQKMGMNHLLADTSQTSVLAKPATHSSPPSQSHPPISTASTTEQGWTDDSRKRPADGMADGAPPLKRGRGRRYSERPAWARLAPTNPHFSQRTNGIKDSHKQQQQQQQHHHHHHHHHHQQQQQQQTNGSAVNDVSLPTQPQQANGHEAPTLDDLERAPWLHYPPPDLDLLRARRAFGRWEKSVDYKTQHPDVDAAVGDWLFRELAGLREVADLPHCAVEIEAKIGWLVAKDGEERMTGFPCENLVVLKEDWARANVRFQSQMDHTTHEAANKFLNTIVRNSYQPGRVAIAHSHPRALDRFRRLSPAGLAAIPHAVMHRRHGNRPLHLRTSYRLPKSGNGEVLARIVKIGVADLHLYNPRGRYDCRISINIEVDLNRPDLAPFDDLIVEDGGGEPDRKKDRMSYRHLAYRIDLTRVDVEGTAVGGGPKYELEVEVDSQVLRKRVDGLLAGSGGGDGYMAVVSGLLENAFLLMRLKPGEGTSGA